MTWEQTEELIDECIKQKLTIKEMKDVALSLPLFDSCNFVVISQKKGIKISI